MNVLIPGYRYQVANLNAEGTQTIQFIQSAPTREAEPKLEKVADGTTTEELLEVLIHRIQYQNSLVPSRENSMAITKLEEALMWQGKRQADRKKRGVQGTAAV